MFPFESSVWYPTEPFPEAPCSGCVPDIRKPRASYAKLLVCVVIPLSVETPVSLSFGSYVYVVDVLGGGWPRCLGYLIEPAQPVVDLGGLGGGLVVRGIEYLDCSG